MMNLKIKSQSIVRTLVAGAALMCAVTTSAMAEPGWGEHNKSANHKQMREQFREHIKARLDRLANRLEIKASQEAAWETYTAAVESLMDHPERKADLQKEAEEDAAALLHRRAERSAEKAKKLAILADATDKLQAVLSDNQRKLFSREVRHQMEHMRHNGGKCEEHAAYGHEWHHAELTR